MAQRDRTQGFGFVYLDVAQLLKQAAVEKEANLKRQSEPAPELETPKAPQVNLNRDPKPQSESKVISAETKFGDRLKNSDAASKVREKLDRLQALHHKLHAMLEELDKLTDKKPKR